MLDAIQTYIDEYEHPKRKALSGRFPFLVGPAVFLKRTLRSTYNRLTLKRLKKGKLLPSVITRHSSLLYKKLGDGNERLQKNKVQNLEIAIRKIDGIIIPAGATFSFWDTLGIVDEKRGYVSGMLLSNGQVREGVGGGLCQLSNFLFWILLHGQTEIRERHHHSVDVFPDSGRTLPFGSGATIFRNYLDLKIKNTSNGPLQIKLWLTNTCLKGQLRATEPSMYKFHIQERNHTFIKTSTRYFRYNEIYRETYNKGIKIDEHKITVNCAPVIYSVTESYLKERSYTCISI